MPRPCCRRRITGEPRETVFSPAGIPGDLTTVMVLRLDEFEALRLADALGLAQDAAAAQMAISRQTFGRILRRARKKVAGALVQGKAMRIEGAAAASPEPATICHRCSLSPERQPAVRDECRNCRRYLPPGESNHT